jgi:hypothetical protein
MILPPSGKPNIYLFSYYYHGDRYALEVPARSKAEAIGRIRQMGQAVYDGELVLQIPAGGSIVSRFMGWLSPRAEQRPERD